LAFHLAALATSVSRQSVTALPEAVLLGAEAPLLSGALLAALGLLGQYLFSHLLAVKANVSVTEAAMVMGGVLAAEVMDGRLFHLLVVRAELSETGLDLLVVSCLLAGLDLLVACLLAMDLLG
jgi:hypothetical protein